MAMFILRRLGVMLLTALCLTFVVFFLTNLYPNLEKLAKTQGNFRMTDEEVASYLGRNGYLEPLPVKYGQWMGVLPGWTTTVCFSGWSIMPAPLTSSKKWPCRWIGCAIMVWLTSLTRTRSS